MTFESFPRPNSAVLIAEVFAELSFGANRSFMGCVARLRGVLSQGGAHLICRVKEVGWRWSEGEKEVLATLADGCSNRFLATIKKLSGHH
jgi:hypothetical protein